MRGLVLCALAACALRTAHGAECHKPRVLEDDKWYSYNYDADSCGSLYQTTCGHSMLIAKRSDKWCEMSWQEEHICCADNIRECCDVDFESLGLFVVVLIASCCGFICSCCACLPCCPLFDRLCCAPDGSCKGYCLFCPGRKQELELRSMRMDFVKSRKARKDAEFDQDLSFSAGRGRGHSGIV